MANFNIVTKALWRMLFYNNIMLLLIGVFITLGLILSHQ